MATNVKNPFDLLKRNYDEVRKKGANEIFDFSKTEITSYNDILMRKKVQFDEVWKKKLPANTYVNNYEKIRTLGSGSFGRVMLAKNVSSNQYFAIKLLDREKIVQMKQIDHTMNEKKILQSIDFPFLVNLVDCLKDNAYIYFVLPFCGGGEMFTHLRKVEKFNEDTARFYAAQVLLGLEYLHYLDLVFRDLKPENIVFDCDGYLRITDFGFCKMVRGRTWTLCGTPEYIAPEIILSRGYGKSVDWWSFGVLIYEMNAGYPPFYSSDHMKLYEKIVSGKYKYASHFSFELKEVIKNLLQVDLTRRYGNLKNGVDDIKQCSWFSSIKWLEIYMKTVPAPWKPPCKSPDDLTNFPSNSKEEPIKEAKFEKFAKEFADF